MTQTPEPVFPVEIFDLILKMYLADINDESLDTPFPRTCPPILVCRHFLAICKPIQFQRVNGLALHSKPQENGHIHKVINYFRTFPDSRRLVKWMDLNLDAEWTLEQVQAYLLGLYFPEAEVITLTLGEEPDATTNQRINLELFPEFFQCFKNVQDIELNNIPTLYLPLYFSMPSLQTLRLNGCLFCLTVELHPNRMPAVDSNVRCLEVEGDIREGAPHAETNCFALSALLLLPKLEQLVLTSIQTLYPVDQNLGFEGKLSFDLWKLDIHVEKEEEIRLLLDLYNEHALVRSEKPFAQLRELSIGVVGKIGGDVPVQHIVQLLKTTNLEAFALFWGWRTEMKGFWAIYDQLTRSITSGDSNLRYLKVPVQAFPNRETYFDAMGRLVAFLDSIATRNCLEELHISMNTDIPNHRHVDYYGSFPIGPWRQVAHSLKSSERFPQLKTLIVHWNCYRGPYADEDILDPDDHLAHYHFKIAMQPLDERPNLSSYLSWSIVVVD